MLRICPIDISANSQHITAAHCTDSWDLSPSATKEGCIPTVCPWISINTPLDAHFIALLNHKAYVLLKFKTTFLPGLKLLQTKSYFGLWVTRCSHNIISSFLWQMLNGETLHSGSTFISKFCSATCWMKLTPWKPTVAITLINRVWMRQQTNHRWVLLLLFLWVQ